MFGPLAELPEQVEHLRGDVFPQRVVID